MKAWNITVEQFQEALPYYKKAIEETDPIEALNQWTIVIAIITGTTVEEIQDMPIDKLKTKIVELSWLGTLPSGSPKFKIEIDGIKYTAPKEESDFNTARYIEYKTFSGKGVIESLHLILATIYQPEEKQPHKVRSEIFKKAIIADVYGMVFFWTKRYKKRTVHIQASGMKIAKQKQAEAWKILSETLKETLDSIGDGTQPLTK